MAKKKATNKKNTRKIKKQREQEKLETLDKITTVYEDNPDFVEVMADYIAPEFDYEFEGRGLAIEEREGPLPDAQITESEYPKEAYQAKTGVGKFFLRDTNQKVLAAMFVVLIGIMAWYGYYWKTIVSKAVDTTAMIYGKEVEFKQIPGTVRENLIFNEIYFDDNDEISPGLHKRVKSDTKIQVDDVRYTSVKKVEEVVHDDYIMLDPFYTSGVKKETQGNDGKGVFIYRTKIVNNQTVRTNKEVYRWIKKPHDHIIHLGTARTGHKGKVKINKTVTANCSAYWMGNNCRGASGGRCVVGTCAVDRFRYPYGTEFWVEGYGYAVANDCGSAIKGDKLDLWMASYGESCRWGRRHMTTYVLTNAK